MTIVIVHNRQTCICSWRFIRKRHESWHGLTMFLRWVYVKWKKKKKKAQEIAQYDLAYSFFSLLRIKTKKLGPTGKKNCLTLFIHEFSAVIKHLMLQMAKYSKLVHFSFTETVYFERSKYYPVVLNNWARESFKTLEGILQYKVCPEVPSHVKWTIMKKIQDTRNIVHRTMTPQSSTLEPHTILPVAISCPVIFSCLINSLKSLPFQRWF